MKFKILFSSGTKKGPFNDAEEAVLYAKTHIDNNRWAIIKKSVDGENYEDFSVINPEGKVLKITDAEMAAFRNMKKITVSGAQEEFNRGNSVVIVPMHYLTLRKIGDPTFKLTAKKSTKVPNWKFVSLIIKNDYEFTGKLEYFVQKEKIEENQQKYVYKSDYSQSTSNDLKAVLSEAAQNTDKSASLTTSKNLYHIFNIKYLKESEIKSKLGGSGNALMFGGKLFKLTAKNIENLSEMINEAEGKTVRVFFNSGFKSMDVQIPGPFTSMDDIKLKAQDYDLNTKYSISKPSEVVLFGRFYIDSVRMKIEGNPRVYRVMMVDDNGTMHRVSFPSSSNVTRPRRVSDVNGEDMFFTDFSDPRQAINTLKMYVS